MDNLGVSRQSIDYSMNSMMRSNSKDKGHKSNPMTLLASIVMNINEQNKNPGQPIDIYSSIATKPELKTAANEFNEEAKKELKNAGD